MLANSSAKICDLALSLGSLDNSVVRHMVLDKPFVPLFIVRSFSLTFEYFETTDMIKDAVTSCCQGGEDSLA